MKTTQDMAIDFKKWIESIFKPKHRNKSLRNRKKCLRDKSHHQIKRQGGEYIRSWRQIENINESVKKKKPVQWKK